MFSGKRAKYYYFNDFACFNFQYGATNTIICNCRVPCKSNNECKYQTKDTDNVHNNAFSPFHKNGKTKHWHKIG